MAGRLLVLGAAVALVGAAIFAWLGRERTASLGTRIVVIDLRSSSGREAQLFWAGPDGGFTEEQSVRVPLSPSMDTPQRLRFLIPERRGGKLRFDPTDTAGEIYIHRTQLIERRGMAIDVAPTNFRSANQIASFEIEGGAAHIVTMPDATDPSLFLSLGCLESRSVFANLTTITPAKLGLMTIAAVALIVGAGRPVATATFAVARGRSGWAASLWLAGLAATVLGAKLLLMHATPVETPFWDQWDGEAASLFVPFYDCSLSWQTMFALHNEHRVFFTRLLALDLLMLNGQWDPRIEQVVNAVIHTLTGVLVALMFWLAAGSRRLDLVVVLIALAFALPFAWENTLAGFQSAFYFLLLFSVAALWLTTRSPVGSAAWLIGWGCAVCALFTAASGILTPIAIAAVCLLQAANDRSVKPAAINVGVALAVFAGGYAMASPPLPHHEVYRVGTATEFFTALGRSLAWPRIGRPELGVIGWLPIGLLIIATIRRRGRTTPLERLTLGLGLWVALHAAALAYGRGATGAMPAGRYMDFLSIGLLVNAMAASSFLDHLAGAGLRRGTAVSLFATWLAFAVVGLHGLVQQSLTDLNAWRQIAAGHTQHVRRFVVTGDHAAIADQTPIYALPYPDPKRLMVLLQEPYIRRVLPAAVRAPIRVIPQTAAHVAFVQDATHPTAPRDLVVSSWGSFSAGGNAVQGRFESEPIEQCELGGLLRFEVAGHLGSDSHSLAVREIESGRESRAKLRGSRQDGWSFATVECPDGPFTIVAADMSRWSWFAFRAPVEIGRVSIGVEGLIARAWPLFLIGLTLLALAARWS